MRREPTPRSVDPILDLEGRRLFASTALTTHARRTLGGRIGADSDSGDLLALARRLDYEVELLERRCRLRFEPPYPGVTVGIEDAGSGIRLVLSCAARDPEGWPLGVVFTTLIPGRLPQVSVAPVGARVPQGWRPLAQLP